MSRAVFEPVARQAAEQFGVDPDVYVKLITQESGWNPNATSPVGAGGIAQFMPGTAQGYGIDPYDPYQALPAGAQYLASSLATFDGDYRKALASYNAGVGGVQQAIARGGANWESELPDETKKYLSIILGGGGGATGKKNYRGMANQFRDIIDIATAGLSEIDDPTEYALAAKELAGLYQTWQELEAAASGGDKGLTPADLFALESSYVATLNDLGLSEYNLALQREEMENDRLTKEFTGKLATYGATLDFDEATRRKAETEIQRWLNIQQEARQRAQSEAQTALDAAPFQTQGGKVAFTASDLGGGVGALAGMANMDPNAELLRYPGLTTIDQPAATDRYIEGMGGAGPAPNVPGMITTPGMIPQAPNLNPYNTPLPSFIAPPNPSSLAAAYNAAAQAQQEPPPSTPSLAVQSRGNDPGVQLPPTFKDNSFVPPGSVPVDAVQLGPDFRDLSYAPNGAPLLPAGGGNIRATGNLLPVPTLEGVQNAGEAIVSGAKGIASLIAPYWRR